MLPDQEQLAHLIRCSLCVQDCIVLSFRLTRSFENNMVVLQGLFAAALVTRP